MRFRLGYVSGFATGYYLGTRAGRQRYEQINRSLRKLKRSETFDIATVRAREVLDETVDKAKGLIEKRAGDAGTGTEATTGTGATNGTATVPSAATASPATAAATDRASGASTTTGTTSSTTAETEAGPPVDTGLAPNPTSNAAGAAPYATETPGKNQP